MRHLQKLLGSDASRRAFLRNGTLVSAVLAGEALLAGAHAAAPGTRPAQSAAAESGTEKVDVAALPRVRQTMVAPPFVPEHEQLSSGPKLVEVTLTIEEKEIEIDDLGTKTWALTYNGSVPGPMIVVHEGDYVEVTLQNPASNRMEHNVDFHSATGALGGGALTKVQPGEQAVLRWKATRPGVFVYHCAPGDLMIPYHVIQGMSGAVMVLPKDGLNDGRGNAIRYDRAYFIGEQDFYIPRDENGEFIAYEGPGDSFVDTLEVMRTLTPTHVVFNGKAGALTGDKALTAAVGETVLFIHAQANRDSRPHLIGGHGSHVWETGSFNDVAATNLETWFIRGGSAGCMVYTFEQPGIYAYVNHNLIEAVLLGATAHVVVDGAWNDDLMMQVQKPGPMA
jgi:nitrite reductase (NO-forming)